MSRRLPCKCCVSPGCWDCSSGDLAESLKKLDGCDLRRDFGRLLGRILRVASLASVPKPGYASTMTLPIGLPWLGAHFRLDALASFFLFVVNLGGAVGKPLRSWLWPPRTGAAPGAAVLSRLSCRHESRGAGGRCVFTFLLCWEFMSLASWALVMAHHRETGQRQGRLHLSRDGELRHARLAAGLRPAGGTGGRLRIRGHPRHPTHAVRRRPGPGPDAARRWIEGRPCAAARLAAARASRRAEPRLGADERRHDQGRDLRLRSRRLRPAGDSRLGGRAWSCCSSAASPP